MRLTRKARLRHLGRYLLPIRRPNYRLARLTVGRTGVIVGHNRFGSLWMEIHVFGQTVLTHFFRNRNPYTTARRPIAAPVRTVFSADNETYIYYRGCMA